MIRNGRIFEFLPLPCALGLIMDSSPITHGSSNFFPPRPRMSARPIFNDDDELITLCLRVRKPNAGDGVNAETLEQATDATTMEVDNFIFLYVRILLLQQYYDVMPTVLFSKIVEMISMFSRKYRYVRM